MSAEYAAIARLALSRERLRQALLEAALAPGAPRQEPSQSHTAGAEAPLAGLVDQLVAGVLGARWATRPLPRLIDTAVQVGDAALRSLAHRHPLGLMCGALLGGGLLISLRPWRWSGQPALLVAGLPQLLLWALRLVPPVPGSAADRASAAVASASSD